MVEGRRRVGGGEAGDQTKVTLDEIGGRGGMANHYFSYIWGWEWGGVCLDSP